MTDLLLIRSKEEGGTDVAELIGETALCVVAIVDQAGRPVEVRLGLAVIADLQRRKEMSPGVSSVISRGSVDELGGRTSMSSRTIWIRCLSFSVSVIFLQRSTRRDRMSGFSLLLDDRKEMGEDSHVV